MKMRWKNSMAQSPAPVPNKAGKLRRFARDEDGSLLIFGVYIFVLILMVAGIGIDLMRAERLPPSPAYPSPRRPRFRASLTPK